jgi:hypothetical protein
MNDKISLEVGARPKDHEITTAEFLIEHNYTTHIMFIKESNKKGVKTPDILMNRYRWEIKSPKKHSRRTVEHMLKDATKQSFYIVVDLRRLAVPDTSVISQIKREAKLRRIIKKLIIITKSQKILDII